MTEDDVVKNPPETYLGDGLYASFNGGQIHLRTKRLNGDHYVVLEINVLDSFFRFVEKSHSLKIIISKNGEGHDEKRTTY